MTTRQRAYQIRNVEHGLCQKCPRVATSKGLCDYHRWMHNALRRTDAFRAKRREARRRAKDQYERKNARRRERYAAKKTERAILERMRRPWLFFGLAPPYTESDVRRAFMNMVRDRGLHTDRGGDPSVFKFYNAMKEKAIACIVGAREIETPLLKKGPGPCPL